MNTKQYNNIIAHTLKNESVESESSLETARAVFNNMGVALPTGTMKEVYDTVCTNDYMGWRSCSKEEAQEAANNGIAAMGISENDVVVLSAKDEDESVAQARAVTTLSEDVLIPGATDLKYYMYTAMATGNPAPVVRIYRADNRVVFVNSAKTWYCINRDMIYGDPSAFDDYYETRSCYNTYVRYNPDDIASSDWTLKQYSNNELKLLFIIDPYGVAHYVKKRAATLNGLDAQIGYKDSVFRMLYGRSPHYYARTSQGAWYETTSRDWASVVSESETLFGMHQVYDLFTWLNIAVAAISVAKLTICDSLLTLVISEAVQGIVGYASDVVSLGEAVAKRQLPAYITSEILNRIFPPNWIMGFIDVYNNLQQLMDNAPNISDFSRDKLNYCANKTDYVVYLQLKNNQFYRAENVYNAIHN